MTYANSAMIAHYNSPVDSRLRRKRLMRLLARHASDYVILFGLVGVSLILNSMTPRHRPFSLNDPSLAYPYVAEEMISDSMLIIMSTLIPILVSVVLSFLLIPGSWKVRAREAHTGFVGVLMSVGVAMLITNTTRPLIAKPRPDFLGRCQPSNSTVSTTILSKSSICTQTDQSILDDGYRNFPSNHSSLSFAGLTFLALLLAAHLSIFDTKTRMRRRAVFMRDSRPLQDASSTLGAWRVVVVLIPLGGATFVALTRVMQYYHSLFDVSASAILGIATAMFAYRYYYPGWVFAAVEEAVLPTFSAFEGQPTNNIEDVVSNDNVLDISPQMARTSYHSGPSLTRGEEIQMEVHRALSTAPNYGLSVASDSPSNLPSPVPPALGSEAAYRTQGYVGNRF